jgi:hypothetical protein
MPAKSKQQWKFMKSVAAGKAKAKGLSKAEAEEYVSSQPSPKGLPRKVKKEKK